ncbi:hypothetical protein RhiirC2_790846 [Rhizophagus irregularis]|uniref:Uncharacterized protein n=1 Tax=Rhizophagus irregularis TaxID=588596 RepID=A0A2N1MKE2_9GLOM|nr:hypothetical protein RhiirC2_790846 [Rhizophagus irregularis]
MTSTLDLGKIKNKGERPPSFIWEDITRGNHVGSGKYHATYDPLNWWNLIDTDPQPNSLPRIARHLLAICPNSAKSMGKIIMHWKSNAKKELGFYDIEKNNTRISETEMNIQIAEALAETNDNDDECDNIWINKFVDLSHKLVIEEVREIPDDILDDSEEEYKHINTNDGNDEEQKSDEKGNYDYDVEELLDEFINEDVEDYEDE